MTRSRIHVMEKPISELTPYKNNPRENDNTVPYLMNSIERFGFLVPIVIDRNGVIITGHTRVKAAKELGMTSVPVICADDLTEEQANEFRLVDNKVQELSWWNQDALAEEMSKLDLNWEDYGFDPLPVPEDIVVWDGPAEAPSESAHDDEPAPMEYRSEGHGCRLLVNLPEGMEPGGLIDRLENEGCTVKLLD